MERGGLVEQKNFSHSLLKVLLVVQALYALLPIPFAEVIEDSSDAVAMFFYYFYFFVAAGIVLAALIMFIVGHIRERNVSSDKYLFTGIVAIYLLNSLRVWQVLASAWGW